MEGCNQYYTNKPVSSKKTMNTHIVCCAQLSVNTECTMKKNKKYTKIIQEFIYGGKVP